ncbi:focadhesin [Scaptodrosophila lebanonensis]|uniref:Focadhesin n=1 Tax=Drosophila lebanonensis TaxID=7225 RepID=A0A6J2TFC8_DROLE|nr:focadhesin [Scaptodrosophila lebanonensis]XP_030374135.1 focadhesin [Scaptodrosophila lebanonensis]
MEEFNSVKANTSVVKLAACLEKIYNKIVEAKEKQLAEHQIKEIEFLKTQCKNEHMQLSLMSCQTLVRLVDEGVLDANSVQNTLLSLLPQAGPMHFTIITDSIVGLQLLTLKRKTSLLKDNDSYQCPYGLKTQQHPLIALLQHPSVNMNDVSNKIIGICMHHDKDIRNHSIEYLRPVFLYMLCNPQTLQDVKPIWTSLLTLSSSQVEARALMQELLSWSKFNNATTCLCTSILVIEAIEYFLQQADHAQSIELCIYQALLVKQLAQYGVDPRPSLQCMLRVLHETREHTQNHYHVLLVLLADSLHLLSPFYLADLLRIVAFIVVQERCGHEYILNMCLDGIIQWMSQTAFIPAEGLALAHQIVQRVLQKTSTEEEAQENQKIETHICTKELPPAHIRNYHPDIAIAFDLANLVESFDSSEYKDVFAFVDALNVKANTAFCQRLHLFLRALFLSREPPVDCWFKIYEVILQIIAVNENIAYDFNMTYIFKLAHEQNPELQLELLRGLPSFAVSKDNVPMILNTIRNLTAENATLCVDLYLRLWRVEARTYPFLLKLIAQPLTNNDKRWELEVARTHAMREICQEKPTLHGSELLPHLSNTLNTCTDESGDLATSLALDAIYALCDSHTVNIASTWQALGSKFRSEQRPQTLKSLYRFFGLVPLLQTPTLEFEQLADDALEQLWLSISRPNTDATHIRNALTALKSYEPGVTLTLRHIPPQFKFDITGGGGSNEYGGKLGGREVVDLQQEAIPGEVWVQLLQKIRPECGDAAADLIAHYIGNEINSYRSGVYRLPEGKPEPRKLVGLYATSPLRSVTNYLAAQARFGDYVPEPYAVTFALRAISKKFPKPIPPLDWSCLTSFFHLSFDARKYCIMIAKNQALHSGTARRLLENFLVDFEPNCFEEDLLLLFSLLPEIANSVSLQILKNFAEKVAVYCFKESQLNEFSEGCLFEKFLDSVKYIYMGKCDIPEVLDVFTLIVERYMDSMNLDSRLFERYTEVVALLHPNAIDGLTTPANWWETPLGKLKKATIIRCYLVLYNTKLPNPLKWLIPIIDAYECRLEERVFFYRHLAATLYAFESDEHSCNWIMEMFVEIQMLLAESSNKKKLTRALYLLDIFILSVDVLSGCAVLLGSVDVVATESKERFALFPESMQYLCDHIFWKDQEAKIYEFLYNLYRHVSIPPAYSDIFREALISSRNKPYFDGKGVWTKYIGLRK